jgi:hypothetical protein
VLRALPPAKHTCAVCGRCVWQTLQTVYCGQHPLCLKRSGLFQWGEARWRAAAAPPHLRRPAAGERTHCQLPDGDKAQRITFSVLCCVSSSGRFWLCERQGGSPPGFRPLERRNHRRKRRAAIAAAHFSASPQSRRSPIAKVTSSTFVFRPSHARPHSTTPRNPDDPKRRPQPKRKLSARGRIPSTPPALGPQFAL